MTYPFAAYDHVHISERETAHRWPDGQMDTEGWEDCLFTSAVELYRYAGGPVPASLTEAEAVRAASGVPPLGPSNLVKLAIGMLVRYGHTFRSGRGDSQLMALAPGLAALVCGSLGNFPRGHNLRRWDPTYDGGHGIFAARFPGRWWWCDPLAPSGYTGQWVTDAQLAQFMYTGATFDFAALNEFAPQEATVPGVKYNSDSPAIGFALTKAAGVAAFDLTQQGVFRPLPANYRRNVIATGVVDPGETPAIAGKPMLEVEIDGHQWGLLQADTDWPAGANKPATQPAPDTTPYGPAELLAAKTTAYLEGRQEEWDRMKLGTRATITTPERP